jgi:hypothetical protein
MQWRRVCLDLGPNMRILGASVELHEDSQSGANAIVVLATSELDGHSVATLAEYLCCHVGWEQIELDFEGYVQEVY